MWHLFYHYLFLISPPFGASARLCFMIVSFPVSLHLYLYVIVIRQTIGTNRSDPDQTQIRHYILMVDTAWKSSSSLFDISSGSKHPFNFPCHFRLSLGKL